MKFGKLLVLRAIPEWRQHYMSYKKLKRILKRVLPSESDEEDDEASASLHRTASLKDLEAVPEERAASSPSRAAPLLAPPSLLEEIEQAFFKVVEDDLCRINAHSSSQRAQVEQAVARLQQKASSSQVQASPLSRFYASAVGGVELREVKAAYCQCAKLRSFSALNHDGIRKIVKKYDKTVSSGYEKGDPRRPKARQPQIVERLSTEPFVNADARALRMAASALEALVTPEQLVALREAANQCLREPSGSASVATKTAVQLGMAVVAGILVTLLPVAINNHFGHLHHIDGEDVTHAQRCLALLVMVVVVWLTEALPYFVTALLVPVGVVCGGVIPHEGVPNSRPDGIATRADTAKLVLDSMFDKTIILVLSGLVAASAVARCQLELRVAVSLQRSLGKRPRLFLLAVMQIGLFTSMCISNVTAPILLLSVVTPLLHELPPSCSYARSLLLGLAFSCNLGGMLTPISSPQNAVAVEALARVGAEISYGEWLALALPLVQMCVFACWLLLLHLHSPCDIQSLPPLDYTPVPLRPPQVLMLAGVGATVLAWATFSFSPLKGLLGEPALVGLMLIGGAFGSGFLTKNDFNGLPWHLLSLIAGGNALGLAVSKSGLLMLAANLLTSHVLVGVSAWTVAVELSLALLLITVFISHTVASIVVMPLVASIGASVGDARGVVFSSVLCISAAMALPMSSFPNVNSLLAEVSLLLISRLTTSASASASASAAAHFCFCRSSSTLVCQDDYGTPFLSAKDFVRAGFPASIVVGGLIAAFAFPLASLLPET